MRMAVRNVVGSGERGADDEQYHVAIRNPAHAKRFIKAHETHYAPWVQQLVEEAPLHLDRGQRLPLPKPDDRLLTMPVGRAVARRKSGRAYGDEPVPSVLLSTLLAAALGVRRRSGGGAGGMLRRNVTNSGNLGSVEAYPIALRVAEVPPGIYHFDSVHHDLVALHRGRFQTWLRECVLFQREFSEAAVAVVLTSAFGRLKAKYGPRGYKLGLFDIGHVSENLYLLATALGLEVCATAGFVDEALDRALGLDGLDTATSLVVLIGNPPTRGASLQTSD
ncbi:MAG: SagB/ThcOx family dehydrogenase [Acetobacteraceae bacterium]